MNRYPPPAPRPLAIVLIIAVVVLLVVTAARSAASTPRARAYAVLVDVFGPRLAPCFLSLTDRETGGTFDPRSTNWRDVHSDGSRGSFGLLQIGAVHRRAGESVSTFRLRMYVPRQNALEARRLYRSSGLRPWGGSCG